MQADSPPPPGALPADQYHQIVSPVLQVCAELAAVRGDPDLYNDMASMLALRALIRQFGAFYLQQYPDTEATVREAIAAAPESACLMVLQRGELDDNQARECLWALDAASKQLDDTGVLGVARDSTRSAWQQLAGNRKRALEKLKLAAGTLVTAIDQWERERDAHSGVSNT